MKHLVLYVIIVLISLKTMSGMWEECNNGLHGAVINTIIKDKDNLFVGVRGHGIYFSEDNGNEWIQLGLEGKNINSIAIKDELIICGGSEDGIYYSENYGESWEFIKVYDDKYMSLYSILIVENTVLIGTLSGIYISNDLGKNWIVSDLNEISASSLFENDGKIYASTNLGIYFSTDLGHSWNFIENSKTNSQINNLFVDGNNIFVGTFYEGMLYTNDNGDNWEIKGLNDVYVSSIMYHNGTIYAGTNKGFFVSYDLGDNWIEIITGFGNHYILSILIDDERIYLGTEGDGIYISNDNGVSWEQNKSSFTHTIVQSILVDDEHIFACTDGSGLYYSNDNGDNWIQKMNGINNSFIHTIVANDKDIYIGTNDKVYYSNDMGNTWFKKSNGINTTRINALAINDETVFAGTYNGLYYSTDKGENWSRISQISNQTRISILFSFENFIFAGTESNYLYISSDNGISWELKLFDSTNIHQRVQSISYNKGRLFVATNSNLYISDDNGENWEIGNKDFNTRTHLILTNDDYIVFVNDYYLYYSFDNGYNFSKVYTNLRQLRSIAINNEYIYLGTNNNGILRSKISEVILTSIEEELISNNKFNIIPNPSSDYIEIQMFNEIQYLSERDNINIFDIRGEKISDIQFSSTEPLIIDITNLSKGVYYIKIGSMVNMFIKN